jgi:hypothetical protein
MSLGECSASLRGAMVLALGPGLSGCAEDLPRGTYELVKVFEVEGRQGIATDREIHEVYVYSLPDR